MKLSHFPEHISFITAYGVEFKLSGYGKYYRVLSGLGFPKFTDISSRAPAQDGETYHDYLANVREIQIEYREQVKSAWDYFPRREEILSVFTPRAGLGTLRFYLPNGEKRDLTVFTLGAMDFEDAPNVWDETEVHMILRFKAHDPFLTNPVAKSASLAVAVSTGMVFPFSLPFIVDDSIMNIAINCTTLGSEETWPTLTIVGPVSGLIVENEANNAKLNLIYNVSNNETLTITLAPGNKRAISDIAGDVSGILFNSDITSFKLLPDPKATGGINSIRFMSTGVVAGGSDSAVSISWYDRYVGR